MERNSDLVLSDRVVGISEARSRETISKAVSLGCSRILDMPVPLNIYQGQQQMGSGANAILQDKLSVLRTAELKR